MATKKTLELKAPKGKTLNEVFAKEKKTHLDGTVVVEEGYIEALEAPLNDLVKQGRAIQVTNQDEYEVAAKHLIGTKAIRSRVVAWFKESKSAAMAAHKAICKQENDMLAPLDLDEAWVRKGMNTYLQEEEDKRNAEAAEASRLEMARLRAKALDDEDPYERNVVEEVRRDPVISAPPVAKGISAVDEYHFEVIDASLVPADYRKVDEEKIGRVVKAMKGEIEIPGVRVWKTKSVRARL